jgi:thioredoxin
MIKSLFISGLLALFIFANTSCANPAGATAKEEKHSESGVIYLNKETFKKQIFDYENNKEWKYNGKVPAILDFYADWCGPCRMVAPVLDEIQKDYKGDLQVFKVDTEKEKELAAVFGIRSLPTIVFIPVNGQPQAIMGFRPKAEMEKVINSVLKVTR